MALRLWQTTEVLRARLSESNSTIANGMFSVRRQYTLHHFITIHKTPFIRESRCDVTAVRSR